MPQPVSNFERGGQAARYPFTHHQEEIAMGSVDLDTLITVGKVAGIVIGAIVDIVKALA